MNLNIFRRKPHTTQIALKTIYPKLSEITLKQIDENIKKSIAKDDDPSKVLTYIKKELSKKKTGKHICIQDCLDLEKIYTENNKQWMFQQNLFCFFSLIISIVWMFTRLINLYLYDISRISDDSQFGIYSFFMCLFLIINHIRQKHTMVFFNTFLNQLNRNTPTLIMIGMFIYYFALFLGCGLWPLTICIIIAILLFIFPIIITLIKI